MTSQLERVEFAVAEVVHGPGFDPFQHPETYDFCAKIARAAIAAMQGWQDIASAKVWDHGVVTDGENVAIAQLAEADFGGTYWACEPDGALEWEPTHIIALPPATTAQPIIAAKSVGLPCVSCDGDGCDLCGRSGQIFPVSLPHDPEVDHA